MERPYTVMLAEDDDTQRILLQNVFEEEGFKVLPAPSVEDALHVLANSSPDLIISDVKMRELDGFMFFDRIHNIAKLQDIPFIFLTAHSDAQSVGRAKQMGAAAYMTKPCDIDELLRTVQNILSSPTKQ